MTIRNSVANVVLMIVASVVPACGGEAVDGLSAADEGFLSEAQLAQTIENGEAYNGTHSNGSFINGTHSNGTHSNGTHSNGTHSNGTALEGVEQESGFSITGLGYLGATLVAELGAGGQVDVYIDDVRPDELSNGMYTYVFREGGHNGPNVCANGQSAIPLNGRWDYLTGTFINDPAYLTIACRGAALAKCIEAGYTRSGTWNDGGTTRSNADLHDACVRMIRADYCGNGISTTHDGTLVDLFDKKGVEGRTSNPALKLEAEWGPNGATCINHTRWEVSQSSINVPAYVASTCPSVDVDCATGWGTGVLRNASGLNDHNSTTFNSWTW